MKTTTVKILLLLLFILSATLSVAEQEHSRCLVPDFDDPVYEAAYFAGDVLDDTPGGPLKAPPSNPGVGDHWDWYLMYHGSMGPEWELKDCTVRGEGTNCYVVVENSQWNVNIDNADVTAIIDYFDNSTPGDPSKGTYQVNSEAFGTPPDELDNDPKIYLLYYDFGISADGFFMAWDQAVGGYSNECEVLYLNCDAADPSGEYLNAVVAHEFEHMIHWKYDADEDSWVDEGCAELAMFFFGHPDNISSFNTNPDNDLTIWDGEWADYIQTYLWTLYLYEQYGGGDTIYTLVHETANSVTGVNNALAAEGYSETMADVFEDWVIANYIDNPDSGFYGGKYGYTNENLPSFNTFTEWGTDEYPVDSSANVNHWASDYVLFESDNSKGADDIVMSYAGIGSSGSKSYDYGATVTESPPEITLTFDGSDNNDFSVYAIVYDAGTATEVLEMTLDGSQAGQIVIDEFYVSVEEDEGNTTPKVFSLSPPYPNPSNGEATVKFALPATANITLGLYDIKGRKIETIAEGTYESGSYKAEIGGLSSGIYIYKLEADEFVDSKKMIVR